MKEQNKGETPKLEKQKVPEPKLIDVMREIKTLSNDLAKRLLLINKCHLFFFGESFR